MTLTNARTKVWTEPKGPGRKKQIFMAEKGGFWCFFVDFFLDVFLHGSLRVRPPMVVSNPLIGGVPLDSHVFSFL